MLAPVLYICSKVSVLKRKVYLGYLRYMVKVSHKHLERQPL